MKRTENLNINEIVPLAPPRDLKRELPITDGVSQVVYDARIAIERILSGDDMRFIAIVGPCSIHDEKAALEYAGRLADLSHQLADRLFVVMRVYFEKPRTTVGWKGLINDPHLNDSFDIEEGLRRARRLLLRVNEMGLPAGTEMLEPVTPQYIADLVSWASIGARTTESPTHRQMASGVSMPVGFKNATDGSIEIAINAIQAARIPHSFLGMDEDGKTTIVRTKGNPQGHLILRGGRTGPNYDAASVAHAAKELQRVGLPQCVLVDCSHANSEKDYRRQPIVWQSVVEQDVANHRFTMGAMLESFLHEGAQKLGNDPSALKYGVSITDGCISWDQTEESLRWAHKEMGRRNTTQVALPASL